MNLMFWKKKAGGTAEGEAGDDSTVAIPRDTETTAENSVRPGLLARLRNALSARRKPGAEGGTAEPQEAETPRVVPVRNMKKRLIIGGAIGLLVLLLAGIGFAVWKIFLTHPEPNPAVPAPTEAAHASQATPHAETSETEIEALKKKNEALQAEIEAIKNEQPLQPPPVAPSGKTNPVPAPSPDNSEMTLSNKDPKAAAQALKTAIEEMNAGSGEAKPKPPAH